MTGRWPVGCRGGGISSITALEFLETQGKEATKANYYIPLANTPGKILGPRDHPFPKHSTDQILLSPGAGLPSHIEFGSLAVSQLINLRNSPLFMTAIEFQETAKIKLLRKRWAYLMTREITCVPLSRESLEYGVVLLGSFLEQYAPKANLRNTINDALILATAISTGEELVTTDSLLARFAGTRLGGRIRAAGKAIRIDFATRTVKRAKVSLESKRYLNRGWRFQLLKRQARGN